ncbi:MAG: aminopeptidase [Gammaproteobacteria bacterium]|nr:aminopeptidase [Gammaproteobacteria bacterium]
MHAGAGNDSASSDTHGTVPAPPRRRHARVRTARRRLLRNAAVLVLAGILAGCGTLGYLGQAARGQLEILARRRPVATVIADPGTPPAVAGRLRKVQELRRFATTALALPDNGSYTGYSALGREYVVWNVFATPELSLEPQRWCYLVAGCFDYRGYFAEADAHRLAGRLAAGGNDVYIGGVAAYSTLGWFDDPVLDTMLRYDDERLARVIFHELAHERLYVRGDTAFNEAFATVVAEHGVRRWAGRLAPEAAAAARSAGLRDQSFVDLVLAARARLERLYAQPADADALRAGKRREFDRLVRDYQAWRAHWNDYDGYDDWIYGTLNNAKLAAVASYHEQVPAFERLLADAGGDLVRFYAAVEAVAALPGAARNARMRELAAH